MHELTLGQIFVLLAGGVNYLKLIHGAPDEDGDDAVPVRSPRQFKAHVRPDQEGAIDVFQANCVPVMPIVQGRSISEFADDVQAMMRAEFERYN
jgi:hypothetical protein